MTEPGQAPVVGEGVASDRIFNRRGQVVFALLGVLILLQATRGVLPADADARLVLAFAFVPASLTRLGAPSAVADAAQSLIERGLATGGDVAALLGPGSFRWWTPATYALLHGGWTHLIVNGVWLASFGSAVARRFGVARFLLFFIATALGGALAHWLTHWRDFAPLVGASASVSGAMAAAARFAFAPGAPLGATPRQGVLEAYQGPSVPLRFLFREPRAATFLLAWFASNLLFGAFVTPIGLGDGAIAWEAHIGGFLVGLLLFPLFDPVLPMPATTSVEPPP